MDCWHVSISVAAVDDGIVSPSTTAATEEGWYGGGLMLIGTGL